MPSLMGMEGTSSNDTTLHKLYDSELASRATRRAPRRGGTVGRVQRARTTMFMRLRQQSSIVMQSDCTDVRLRLPSLACCLCMHIAVDSELQRPDVRATRADRDRAFSMKTYLLNCSEKCSSIAGRALLLRKTSTTSWAAAVGALFIEVSTQA